MKKNNNKGFTLVELLAVIVILLAISVIAIPSISAGIERTKKKTDESKKAVLASYAEIYVSEHQNVSKSCVNVSELSSYLSEEEKTDSNGNQFTGRLKYNSSEHKYVYEDGSC